MISGHAIVGSYFFRRAADFLAVARLALSAPLEGKEPTIAPLYNLLIARGLEVGWAEIEEYHSFGTPEELAAYEKKVG